MTKTGWTKEFPAVSGIYWARWQSTVSVNTWIVEVTGKRFYMMGRSLGERPPKYKNLVTENTALREQLVQADFRINTLKQDLEQVRKNNAQFQAELAQVEKERPLLSQSEIKVLTDYHYYEADKAITRRGDRAVERQHLERLAIIRAAGEQP